jgi:hypothetical protein
VFLEAAMCPDTELLTGWEEVNASSETTIIYLVPDAYVMNPNVIASLVNANVLVATMIVIVILL